MNDISKDVLKVVNEKTGKKVSKQAIDKLAKSVPSGALQSEAQLRSLILQISKTVNVPVSRATTNEIIQAVKRSGGSLSSLEPLIKSMIRK